MLGYQIASAITTLMSVVVGIFIFRSNSNSQVNRSYAYLMMSVALWSFGMFFHVSQSNEMLSLFWGRFMHAAAICIPLLFFIFVLNFLKLVDENKFFITCAILFSIFLLALIPTKYFISSVSNKLVFRYFVNPGIVYPIFIGYYGTLASYSFLLLIQAYKKKNGHEKMQIAYVGLASLCGFFGGATTFLVVYGANFTIANSYGVFFVSFFNILIAYAIIRHKLMDIEVIIRRTAVFAGLFAFVYGTFTIITILGREFFKSALGWNQWIATIPTVLIITFTLRPLEIFLTNLTERWLFQKKYDYRELLRTFTNEILTVLDLNKLTEQTVAGLIRIIKLESAAVLLLDKDTNVYKLVAGTGVKDKNIVFKENDLIVSYLKQTNQHILKDKSVDKMEGDGELKDTFKKLNARLCLPIELHDNLIGILCLGMKKSGEDFTQEDIDILNTLVRTEAIAISNAQLFDELAKMQSFVIQQEKMVAVGTLAAGMAHEIKNPLVAIQTFTEYLPVKYDDPEFREKFVRIVSGEVNRIHEIVKNLLLFSKPSKPNKRICSVNEMLKDILDLLSNEFIKLNVQVRSDFEAHRIFADPEQLKQAFLNVILNAVEAMKKCGGTLYVHTTSIMGEAEITIADTGCGIPQEDIPRIFDPFYTSKEEGTGLGLAVTHSMVEKNGGRISVNSEVGMGTTFTLRFPTTAALMTI